MPRPQRYAPMPPHDPNALGDYRRPWRRFMDGLREAMGGSHSRINHEGTQMATLYSDNNLRYDRQAPCRSYGHPRDDFVNYQVQANRGADDPRLRNLAARGNGQNRAEGGPGRFPGSTIASINVQQGGGYIPPGRIGYALHHSQRHGQSMYVVSESTNLGDIPARMRQSGAVYHGNPLRPWPDRYRQPGNPYRDSLDSGGISESQMYYDPNTGEWWVYYNNQWVRARDVGL